MDICPVFDIFDIVAAYPIPSLRVLVDKPFK